MQRHPKFHNEILRQLITTHMSGIHSAQTAEDNANNICTSCNEQMKVPRNDKEVTVRTLIRPIQGNKG